MPSLVLSFRAVAPGDTAFLFDLYRSTRGDEFAFLDESQRRPLMQLQFSAQQSSYLARFPGSDHRIIECGGEAAGRIWVARTSDGVRIVDISLLPAFRRQGVGTMVYRAVLAEAAAQQTQVSASVLKSNAESLRFHEAIGFTIADESDLYYTLTYGGARRN